MTAFDPKHAAAHGYTRADWDAVDSPELTEAELATARPFAEALPELAASLRRSRGPQKTPTKEAISLRLDADLLVRLRASGPGWQTRVNDALRAWLDTAAR